MRLVIVGCGRVADRRVAPATRDELARAAGVMLHGFCSRDLARANDYVHRHEAQQAYASLADVASDDAVDAAYLATPNALHGAEACELLAAGKHVICDKPLATTLADAQKMVAAARAARRHLTVAQQMHFHPAHVELRAMHAKGELGTVAAIDGLLGFPLPIPPGGWRVDPAMAGGGVWVDLAPHVLDVLLAVAEHPAELLAATRLAVPPGGHEHDRVLATFSAAEASVVAHVGHGLRAHGGQVSVVGTQAACLLLNTLQQLPHYEMLIRREGAPGWERTAGPSPNCFALLLADFARTLAGEQSNPTITLDHALRVQAAMNVVQERVSNS